MYDRLQDSGYFFDPVQREVEQQVMPWLLQETQNEVTRRNTARWAATLGVALLVTHLYMTAHAASMFSVGVHSVALLGGTTSARLSKPYKVLAKLCFSSLWYMACSEC